ncbi:8-amino-7-oxononanoate synthase [Butyriboletus roseoflavus]|nr:8-amino-7-oxononanoate synthase [Butyriboletus roseoflavus]
MPRPSPLLDALQKAIADRAKEGMTVFSLDEPLPSYAPDFFSNDYLSLSTDRMLRDIFLCKVQAAPQSRLFGSTGSRLATGNSAEFNTVEKAFKRFFGSPSALLVGSGFSANLTFLATVPQKSDVIIYDELIHSSCREGIRLSSRASYRFAHNSLASLEECLLGILQKHLQIIRGTSTVFVVVESLYSMDGDFCPLTDIVDLVEALVPAGHAHIVVDEAHTSGICGPNGTGYVSHLGLNDRIHTKVHTFGKAWGFHGAVVLTSPIIRDYLINFAKSIMFSTSMPYTDIYALESCLSVMSSAPGQEFLFPSSVNHLKLRQCLHHLSRYARQKLFIALRSVPETILALSGSGATVSVSDHGLCSPVIPIFTPYAARLADYLLQRGYAVSPITFPVVKRPRIRVIIHAGNTVEEIDSFIDELLTWAGRRQSVFSLTKIVSGSAGMGESYAEARARL